ncbi:MAG TPA: ABC transporter permease [Jiangellaceae bacterium]
MRKIVTITWFNLVRLFRERSNLFFVLIFPILLVAVIGSQFGDEGEPEIGVTGGGSFTDGAAERLEATGAATVRAVDDADALRDDVSNGTLPVGVVVPDDVEAMLQAGDSPELTVLVGESDEAPQLAEVAARAFTGQAVVPGVTGELAAETGLPAAEVAGVVAQTSEALAPVEIVEVAAGGGELEEAQFGFDQIAVGILLLFTFLNALTGATALIQSRKYGVSRRMVATPTSLRSIVLGEGLGRWAVGMFQGVYIMVASALLFAVSWGNLGTAVVVLAVFAAVAAGAAMLIGALMSNDEQAAGITVMVGLVLGALGGSMFPLELFGSTMTTVAHVTPHAWGIDAFTAMIRHDATLADLLTELGVLAAMAIVLVAVATWRLRVTLTRA